MDSSSNTFWKPFGKVYRFPSATHPAILQKFGILSETSPMLPSKIIAGITLENLHGLLLKFLKKRNPPKYFLRLSLEPPRISAKNTHVNPSEIYFMIFFALIPKLIKTILQRFIGIFS